MINNLSTGLATDCYWNAKIVWIDYAGVFAEVFLNYRIFSKQRLRQSSKLQPEIFGSIVLYLINRFAALLFHITLLLR